VKHLKTGSKTSFYKWIDDIKKAYRHKTELEEKLQFYETRLIGYNAVTYDSIGSSSTKNNVEENLLYVIGKIDKVKARLDKAQKLIDEYNSFKSKLKPQEALVLEYLVETSLSKSVIGSRMKISKSRLYDIIIEIIKQYSGIKALK
jgi:DNA-directed RNA polymerase specialized sigma subunit